MSRNKFFRTQSRALLCLAVTLTVLSTAPAAVPVLVKDINAVPTGSVVKDSYPSNLLSLNGHIYFSATTALNGTELYVTDGTSNGTSLLKDISPGSGSSSPSNLTRLDATRFVFTANDSVNGTELWISDGTSNGTTLLKDINSNSGASSNPTALTNIGNGIIIFWATDGSTNTAHGAEVWRTDGTPAGTFRLSDIASGSASSIPEVPGFIPFAGKVYFAAQDSPANAELYSTDGANPASTALVKEINPAGSSAPQHFIILSPTQMLFRASDGLTGDELWTTDGTASGTQLLKDINPGPAGSAPTDFTLVGSSIFFSAIGSSATGRELYITEGTAAGTRLVADIYPGKLSSNPRYLTAFNNKLYFNAGDPTHGLELFTSDGTSNGTTAIDAVPGITGLDPWNLVVVNFPAIGPRLLFQGADFGSGADSKPWISDGTLAGTSILKDIYQGNTGYITVPYTTLNGSVLFSATDRGPIGRELWITDGTNAGTQLVADLAQPSGTADSSPANLTAVGSTLFFTANDGIHGTELWKSDGTSNGTNLVSDIQPGTASGGVSNLAGSSATLFFQANDGSTNHGAELWTSDAASNGGSLLKDIRPGTSGSSPSSLTYNGSVMLFAANDGTNGTELWSSDGTSTNTSIVLDLNPGSASSSPGSLFRDGSDVYMSAAGPSGTELYRYRSGALSLVADINPGSGSSFPTSFAKLGNYLLYRASDGVLGSELWRTDVTNDATTCIADINPGSGNSTPQLPAIAGNLLFFVASDGTHGFELWATDGNTNTYLVKDINSNGTSSGVLSSAIAALGNKVIFAANDGLHGKEPWVSDGTAAGTFMLKQIADGDTNVAPFGQGSLSSGTPAFIYANGYVYFAANDGQLRHGNELWRTDGTSAGTTLVADINTGSGTTGWSNPANFVLIGNRLFFAASDGTATHGRELFMLDTSAP